MSTARIPDGTPLGLVQVGIAITRGQGINVPTPRVGKRPSGALGAVPGQSRISAMWAERSPYGPATRQRRSSSTEQRGLCTQGIVVPWLVCASGTETEQRRAERGRFLELDLPASDRNLELTAVIWSHEHPYGTGYGPANEQ